MKCTPHIIAIAGGTGAGKSWLANRLQMLLSEKAARISLDDFYRDRSHLPPSRREKINYDHPRAVDWKLFESVLRRCRTEHRLSIPRYDFATHTRFCFEAEWLAKPVILVDGLWLLRSRSLRRLFDLKIFIDTPKSVRRRRRVLRDLRERGRSSRAAARQWLGSAGPMHEQFVAPQARAADLVLTHPFTEEQIEALAARIWNLVAANDLFPAWMRATFRLELLTLIKPTRNHEEA